MEKSNDGYRQFPAESELLSYSTGAILALHWGTLHRTIRTKDAAIAGFGAEQRLTANAFVERIGRSQLASFRVWRSRKPDIPTQIPEEARSYKAVAA